MLNDVIVIKVMPIITGNNRFEKQVSTLGLEHVPECGATGGAYKGYKEQVILPRGFTAGEGECRGQGLDLTTVRHTEKLDKMLTELTNTSPH